MLALLNFNLYVLSDLYLIYVYMSIKKNRFVPLFGALENVEQSPPRIERIRFVLVAQPDKTNERNDAE